MEKNYEISPNLIEQVQILLKNEIRVGYLSSQDHSLYISLQSSYLNDAIVESNSSANVLRCKNCEGGLLRGSESIICVYCGHAQNQDFVRQPISFKSTFAYQWFLQSLGLDGFENVGKHIEGNQSGDREQRSFKEEILLSDLLDLQLKWVDDDSRGYGVQNDEQLSGKKYLSLVGVYVEEILAQERRDHDTSSVSIEQAVASEKTENEFTKISGEGSLSLFENMQSSEASLRSGENETNESFFGWGADFQSAFPGLGHEKSANLLISEAPSVRNVTASRINIGSNLEVRPPFKSMVSDGNISIDSVGRAVESDASVEGLPVNHIPTMEDYPNNEQIDAADSFDEWGDFSMSTSGKITQSEPSSTAVLGADNSGGLVLSDPFNNFIGSVVSKDSQTQNNTLRVPDDAWNTFITPSTGGDIQLQDISGKLEQHVGIGNTALGGVDGLALLNVDQFQGRESKSIAPGTINELDDSFDLWDDFKGSDNQQQATNVSAGAWNDFSGIGVGSKEEQADIEIPGWKENGDQNDSLAFGSWNDFTRFGVVSDSKHISNNISSGAWDDFSSLVVAGANKPRSSNIRTFEHKAILEDDNLLSSWNDCRSSEAQAVNSVVGPNDTMTNSDSISFHKDPNSLKMIEGNITFSSLGDFGAAKSILEQQLQVAGAGSSENKLSSSGGDLFSALTNSGNQSTNCPEDPLQFDGVTILDKSTCENDDSFNVWSDFTSSSNVKVNLNSSANAPHHKEVKLGDKFDLWNVSVSSPNVEAGKDTAIAMGTPELNLFSPNVNSQNERSKSLMQSDLSVRMFGNQNGSALVQFSPPEGPDTVRC
ncbi:Translation initiation factor 2 subunit gamma [Bienertia sinuspersici]